MFYYFSWILSFLYVVLVVGAVVAVLLGNRQPVRTMAWILVIVTIPFVGLIFYYFFGQDIRRERMLNRKSIDLLTQKVMSQYIKQSSHEIPAEYESLILFFKNHAVSLPFGGNAVRLFTGGDEFILDLVRQIERARHHVHLQSYIIEDDAVGRLVRDALIDAVHRGVVVRVIYDDVGCWSVCSRFFDEMEREGVVVLPFLPVHFPSLTRRMNYRNHRKLCVIDGKVGLIGGMNIALRYVRGEKGKTWRDLHVHVEGAAVYGIQLLFLSDWYYVSREMITDPKYYPLLPEQKERTGALMQIVSTMPFGKWPNIMYGFNKIILGAKRYVYIQTPYFMPTETVLNALQTAALSGVKVELMVPEKPGGFWMTWANESYLGDVLRAGVAVYLYRPGMLHAKTMVVDDTFCSVGSANMDFRSLVDTFEDSAFIYDHDMTMQVKSTFIEARKDCVQVEVSDWNNRNLRRKLIESFVRIFTPLF